jgi:uncharacterized protein YdhG (YjbR/CyaY superfamily)
MAGLPDGNYAPDWQITPSSLSRWTRFGHTGNISRMKRAAPSKKKKADVGKRGSVAKSRAGKNVRGGKKPTGAKTVEEYFARVPENAQAMLTKLREAIRSSVPADTTEVISYGIPAFKGKKVLVWYAVFADHCSLFPTAAVIDDFRLELKAYSTSKGTIHFALDKPLPVALIRKIVKARGAQAGGQSAKA